MEETAILYHNNERTAFLIDIPASIALAQELSPVQRHSHNADSTTAGPTAAKRSHKGHILSSPPLEKPYPSTTEPKTDSARAKVLERIPVAEQVFHAGIESLVQDGLRTIHEGYQDGSYWCLPRHEQQLDESRWVDSQPGEVSPKKRKWAQGQLQRGKAPISSEPQSFLPGDYLNSQNLSHGPPVILSPTCLNVFESMTELHDVVVKNTSPKAATLSIRCSAMSGQSSHRSFSVPPLSNLSLCTLPMSNPDTTLPNPVPGLPRNQKFNLILMDPPWSNRSVRRSRNYQTHPYFDMEAFTERIRDILRVHLYDNHISRPNDAPEAIPGQNGIDKQSKESIAAIWVTNSAKARKAAYDAIQGAGLDVCEEWAWIKTTSNGEPIALLNGIWRKPYEIVVIGRKRQHNQGESFDNITRRVIAAVPDIHSRKPNLREIFEKVFFTSCSMSNDDASSVGVPYSTLEVFARNLTAGWWACGNEVLKFNSEEWWTKG
ncbi:hypothetical protein ASPWEDRAFT_120895 [Aspergillus wentii DTO 134E9]|uniref:MT-A70-domain-containing protein n=1 Tax=Aspergillus wentii DTO 134E9 TaxID=1073089 RepID=A0A1L9R6Z4_ASPWE|nr:uncharacterized protein ASPWEDRAFT_120895 [Aspergillus wentii DTO 134E9]KAI9926681.1 Methyltransferase-like protein 4 [Aspergillus wentii]OJJ30657.1 hypothetical protein ASPWEDRAFT_120895 [Aspergillus wentii DTO 134E9]